MEMDSPAPTPRSTRAARSTKKARSSPPAAAPEVTSEAAPVAAQPYRPNVSRQTVRLGESAYEDLAAAFGGNAAALAAIDRFRYLRALRLKGKLTDWPDGEDDYAAAA
jgi:hypothetical protein